MTRILTAGAVLATLACSADRTAAGPEITSPLHTDPGFLISDPVETSTSPSGAPATSVWVALMPGTVATGFRAEVRRPGRTTAAGMVNGGLDPVEVQAVAGDTVEVAVFSSQTLVAVFRDVVPGARAPRIVRTTPVSSALDVPLGATIRVVFSEPIDPATVSSTTLRLRSGTVDVAFQVSLQLRDVSMEVLPTTSLAPETVHTLELTTGLRDLAGQSLIAPSLVSFTTGG